MSTPPPNPYQPGDQQGAQGQQPPQAPPPPPPGYSQSGSGQPGTYGQPRQPWNAAPGGAPGSDDSPKNFLAALFDWRFHTLITPRVVSWVYLIGTILGIVYWLIMLIVGFSTEPILGVLVLVVGPVVFIVSLALFRMTLEFYFALVRMSDDIHRGALRNR